MNMKCGYDEPYIGPCKNEALIDGVCERHHRECSNRLRDGTKCTNIAHKGCTEASSMVL